MSLDFQALIDTLPVLAKGMAGIFAVTVVIIAVTALLNLATRSKNDKK